MAEVVNPFPVFHACGSEVLALLMFSQVVRKWKSMFGRFS